MSLCQLLHEFDIHVAVEDTGLTEEGGGGITIEGAM